MTTTYLHKNRAPAWLLCLLGFGWLLPTVLMSFSFGTVAFGPGLVMGIAIALFLGVFHHLTVAGREESLTIRFGPIPLFCKTTRYADIKKVEVGRTLLGPIQVNVYEEWVWNAGGFDCVVVHTKKGVLKIGTDDAINLVRFLEEKIVSTHAKLQRRA